MENKIMSESELMVLCTVVNAEIADINAMNNARIALDQSMAYDCYTSENYDLLCGQLELIKQKRN